MPIPSRVSPVFIRLVFPAFAGVLLLTGCTDAHGSTFTGATQAAAAKQGPYVALGDSYTSGPDIPNQIGTPVGCQRSDHNYPSLVAQNLHLSAAQVRDVSCSAATVDDLATPQSTGNGTNPAQLTALTVTTTLVTLGIGGNDIDFAAILTRCVELDLIPALISRGASGLAPCRASYTSPGPDQIQQRIQTASGHLADALIQIARRAPHARVYVVGYPRLLPDGGAACAHTLGITSVDVTFLNNEEVALNSMLRQRAEAAGAVYVDTYTPSSGHDACSDPATRWIEPLKPTSPAAVMHPNARGQQAMADAVTQAITAH